MPLLRCSSLSQTYCYLHAFSTECSTIDQSTGVVLGLKQPNLERAPCWTELGRWGTWRLLIPWSEDVPRLHRILSCNNPLQSPWIICGTIEKMTYEMVQHLGNRRKDTIAPVFACEIILWVTVAKRTFSSVQLLSATVQALMPLLWLMLDFYRIFFRWGLHLEFISLNKTHTITNLDSCFFPNNLQQALSKETLNFPIKMLVGLINYSILLGCHSFN